MDLFSKRNIKNLLKKYQIRPSKGLGQNFLVDKKTIRKIIETANLKPEDIILEIGPGLGALTQELAKKVRKVIGIEKDPKMVEILQETLKDFKNVEIIQGDIRQIENLKLLCVNSGQIKNYKVVANLPFYLTAPVIRKFLEVENPTRGRSPSAKRLAWQPKEMTLVVQKEVGQRICSKPPDMSILAVSVQFYAKPEIISYISKKSFWPQPKIDGVIIKIIPIESGKTRATDDKVNLFFRIVRAGFSQPRKQIINNLSKKLNLKKEKVENWLLENNIQPTQRAETLSIEDWINLVKSFKSPLEFF